MGATCSKLFILGLGMQTQQIFAYRPKQSLARFKAEFLKARVCGGAGAVSTPQKENEGLKKRLKKENDGKAALKEENERLKAEVEALKDGAKWRAGEMAALDEQLGELKQRLAAQAALGSAWALPDDSHMAVIEELGAWHR